MVLNTRQFGEIDFDEKKQIVFQEGIPGFELLKKFIVIEDKDENSPFSYLQSTEDGDVAFVVTDPYCLKEKYEPQIQEIYFEKLGGGEDADFVLLAIITIPKSIKDSTINLKAPLLIQLEKREGIQVILEDKRYQTKHRLMELMGNVGE